MIDKTMILRSAFWSGRLTYRKWRGIVRKGPEGHTWFFVQSFLHLPIEWLLKEINDEKFISIWPDVRKGFDKNNPLEAASLDAWDAIWGVIAAGDSQYPVSHEVAHLPRMRREVLKTVVCNPGISIYDLAKRLRRDYSRVLKDVRLLTEMSEIEIRPDPQSSRKAKGLIPARSINAVLAGFTVQ
ncbi:MAG TPA: hypothetical protein DEP53_04830 [Bacteroidetes bacterium]|nr:MAG: hypothetical protein A2X99_11690 [Deltaproteobacteria bacterium GWB2_55_19]HCA79040.1 hypothetical protein [Bacteroidota bacterium]